MLTTYAFEELGRYLSYANALKNGDDITNKSMIDLNDHKHKFYLLARYFFKESQNTKLEIGINLNKIDL